MNFRRYFKESIEDILRPYVPVSSVGDKPIFCLSTGRVGSQTLAQLAGLVKVRAEHEPRPYLFGLSKAAYSYHGDSGSTEILREAVKSVRPCQDNQKDKVSYIETSPQATFLAPTILEVYPNAKFIHIVRHPGDVVRSGMRRGWYQGHQNDCWRIEPKEGPALSSWEEYGAFEKNVWLWSETNQWIRSFLADLDRGQALTLKSEDIFQSDRECLRSYFEFLSCDMPPSSKINNVLGKRFNSQRTGDYPSYSDWSSDEKQLLQKHAGSLMELYGYKI